VNKPTTFVSRAEFHPLGHSALPTKRKLTFATKPILKDEIMTNYSSN